MKPDRKTHVEADSEKLKMTKKPRSSGAKSKSQTNGKDPIANYEYAPIGIIESSPDGKHINANEEFCRLLGYSKQELMGKSLKEITHEDDYPIDIKLHQQLVEGKIPFYRLEKRYLHKNGTSIWAELTRSVIRDAAGNALYTLGVVLDISDRKHVERVLRESTERLRLATEAARMFTWELDLRTQTYTLPDNFEQVLGFSAGLLPKNSLETVQKLSPPEDAQIILEAIRKAAENHSDLHDLQYRMIDPESGQTVWLEANAKIVYDEDGFPERMFGVAQNITQNKRAEELERISAANLRAAAEANAKFRAFFDQGSYFAGVMSLDGTLVEANRLSLEYCGFTREDVVGKKFWDCGWWSPSPVLMEMIRKGTAEAAGGKLFRTESPYHLADGSTRYVDLIIAPVMDDEGQVLFLAPTGTDITERKLVEEKLRQQTEILEWAYVVIRDIDSRIISWNKGVEQLYGWTKEEALGKVSHELFQTKFPVSFEDAQEKLLANGEWEGELEHVRRDGTKLIVLSHQVLHRDAEGKPVAILEDNSDITERRRVERQQEALYEFVDLLNRVDSFEDVFDAALDAILNALQCDRASILLFDDKNVMNFVAWRGLSDGYRKATNGHSPWTVDETNPEPICMNDVLTADLSDSLRATIKEEGIGALAFIPLVVNGKLIGKFMTYYNAPHVFNEDEVSLSMTIARQLAFGVDRKRAEEALARERELLNRLFETMPVMVSMYDPKTDSLRLNAEFERRIGWKTGELSIRSMVESIYPDPGYRAQVIQSMSAVGQNDWVEVQVQTREGHTLDSMWANISILNDRYIGIGVDITERKRAEKQIRDSEEKYRQIVETASEGIWEIDKDTRTIFVNARMAEMLGYTVEEMLGRSSFEFLFPEDRPLGEQRLEHAKYGVPARGSEFRYRRKDGSIVWLMASNTPKLDEQGNFLGAFAMMSDITERKQAEKRVLLLAEISELLRNSEDPSELLYAVSQALGEHLQVKRCLFNEIDLENDIEIVHQDYVNGVSSVAGVHKVSDYSSVTTVEIAAGKTIVNTDSKADPRTAQLYERIYEPNGERAYVAVPMMRDHRWVASLWISDDAPRQWSPEEVSLLEAVAERTWTVIEKLRIAEELRARETELEAIITQTPFMLTRCTRDLRYRFVSRAYAEMIGRTPEEVAGQPIAEMMGEEGFKTISPYIEKVLQGERVEYESEVAFEGAKTPFLHVVYTPDRDDEGNVIGWFASIVDISERKLSEKALQASEQRFREIFETAGVSVWLEDFTRVKAAIDELRAQGIEDFRTYFLKHPEFVRNAIGLVHILDVNNETLDLFGARNKTDLLGSLSNVFAPETEQIFVEELLALAEGRETLRAETQVRSLDGRPISVLFTVHFATSTLDQSHVVVTLTDITERKRAEEALRIENERFMRFVDSNIVGILIGEAGGKVVLANDYYLNLLGVNRQDLMEGRVDWRQFTPPEWLPSDEKAILELRQRGVSEPYEKEYLRADGTRVPVFITNALLPGLGDEIAAFVIDITERKRAEEQLRRSAEFDAFRVALTDTLRPLSTPEGILAEAMRLLGEHLQVDRVLYSEIQDDDETILFLENYVRDGVAKLIGRSTLNDFGKARASLSLGQNLVIVDATTSPDMDETDRAAFASLGIRSGVGIPLIKNGRWAATLGIHHGTVRTWRNDEITLLEETAERIWGAIERARFQEALRASEALYRSIARSIPGGGVYVVDKDMRYLVADGAITESFGLSREILEGHTVSEVFKGEQRARMIDRLNRNFAGETVSYETEHKGRVYWTQQAPLSESIGQAIIVTLDITERKRAEEALRQSEERFTQFMEHLPGLAWIKDLQGRYVYANISAQKAFNMPREKLYGKTDQEIFPVEVANQFTQNDEQALREDKGIQVIETLQQNDGILHYSLVSKFPIPGPDGSIELVGGTAFDITERKRAEEALQLLNLQLETRVIERTAELQAMNESLQDEIKERRQVELALDENRRRLQILTQRLVEVQEEERRAIARELHDRVGQTLSALNINLIIMKSQILPDSLERLGPRFDDSMQLVGETITLVRDVMSNLRPAVLDDYGLEAAIQSHINEYMARYGIKVIFDRTAQPIPRLGPSIEMTFLRIAQEALMNIVRHANASQVNLSLRQEGESICMTIQDNGSGIVSWQQANRPGSHGLVIMRERAEAFGGNLKVGSVPGKGTKIEMSIPISKGSQNEVQKEMLE